MIITPSLFYTLFLFEIVSNSECVKIFPISNNVGKETKNFQIFF